jgi:hypothetical protein
MRTFEMIESWCSNREHSVFGFTELSNTICVFISGNEMEVGHLRYGMADCLIEGTFGRLATM